MLKGRLPLILAVAFGLAAGALAWVSIKQRFAEVRKGWDLVEIIVADQDIEEGEEITNDVLSKRKVPELFATRSVLRPSQLDRDVYGRTLVMALKKGEPLTWAHFQTNRGFERLSSVVDKTLRAVSIRVNNESSVGGFVRPNDQVDILATMRDPQSGDMVTVTVLQKVNVLATGNLTYASNLTMIKEEDKNYSSVTVQVLPVEAEMLVLAQELGTIYLTLRNAEDPEAMESQRSHTNMNTLFTGDRGALTQKRQGIQVIRGK
ncbi:MAG: hypothetical protein GMKNLPBB_00188 [Myxococcota bacterium]|nr:hypothetical protein [Myxococcota bacterium]